MIDISELVAPYIKDHLIDWNYINENLTISLTSPSEVIRKAAEICHKHNGNKHRCNYEFNDILEPVGGISSIAASYVKSGVVSEINKNIVGVNSSDMTIYAIKATITRYLSDCVNRGIVNDCNNLVVVRNNDAYEVGVHMIFYPFLEIDFRFSIH